MNKADYALLNRCVEFALRFGFLDQGLFFKHICVGSRSHKYRKWGLLIREKWFSPNGSSADFLYPTPKAKKYFEHKGGRVRPSQYITHDSIVADLFLTLEKTGLVVGSWTEAELSENRWNSHSILGSDRLDKIPDLIVDMKTATDLVRVAIEVELTRKSRRRYSHMSLSYLGLKKVDLVLFVYSFEPIALEIHRAFHGNAFQESQLFPVLMTVENFKQLGLDAPITYRNANRTLSQSLEDLTQLNINVSEVGDGSEIEVAQLHKGAA